MHDNQILVVVESRIMTIRRSMILRVKLEPCNGLASRLKKIKLCGKTYLDRLEIEEIIKTAFE